MPSVELPLGDTLRVFSDLSDIDYHEQLLGGMWQATIEIRVFEKEIGLVEWINFIPLPALLLHFPPCSIYRTSGWLDAMRGH